jgi:energy-coupling factor transporter transmembrane protein EcfT
MKEIIKLAILICYTTSIFFITNIWVLIAFAVIDICMFVFLKLKIKQIIRAMLPLGFVLIVTFILNCILADLNTAILVDLKIILSFVFICEYRYILTATQIAKAFEYLCYPLKIFGVNPREISLMINIAITFVPICAREFSEIMVALKAKGYKQKRIQDTMTYLIQPYLYRIVDRVISVEYALKSKGYDE